MDTDAMMQALMSAIDEMVPKTETLVTQILIAIEGYSLSRIPIETSNLINSQYRHVEIGVTSVNGRIWNGAEYAVYVHEAEGKLAGLPRPSGLGEYWGPTGEPRFMAKGIDDMVNQDLEALIQINLRV